MDISQYLRIANTTGIDANARIELNTEGGVSAVGTSKIGRLGERIIRNATDAQHYTQVRQNFLDSLKTLYGVEHESQLPKIVLDAFKDEEVVCGKPLTKRRITSVLDAVRRHLDYSSLHELSRGVAEHVEAFGDKVDVGFGIDLEDEGRSSLYDDPDEELDLNEGQVEEKAKTHKSAVGDFEIVEQEKVAGPSLQDRIRSRAQRIFPDDRDRFAANISGKFVGAAADNLMMRFDKFVKIYESFLEHCQQCGRPRDNYAIDWLEKMYLSLTTSRKGNNDFANKNVIRPGRSENDSLFLSPEQMDKANCVDSDTYSLDEAIGILLKWKLPEAAVPKEEAKDPVDDDDYDNKSEFNEEVGSQGDGFDLEEEKSVFNMDVALSFNDPKLTKKVLEGAKKFATKLRAEAKANNLSKQGIENYVNKGMEFFKGNSYNKMLGELWTDDHQRLENPENNGEFEKEMCNIRSWIA